ncbi:MAG: UbiA family prenyltransferase [Gemmatirosa sp.]
MAVSSPVLPAECEASAPPAPADGTLVPLLVDVDGCLARVDLLWEGMIQLATRRPAALPGCLSAAVRGRAALKAYVAREVPLTLETLPLTESVTTLVDERRAAGCPVMLVSGADETQVRSLAGRVGAEAGYGSDGTLNLTGHRKLARIREQWGRFDYVGNALADVPLWEAADRAFAANAGWLTLQAARRRRPDLVVLDPDAGSPTQRLKAWLRAIRPHQWSKNALIVLPALAAHLTWDLSLVGVLLLGVLTFSITASSIYLVNDLVDLPHDRLHPTKRRRPFAAGELGSLEGALAAVLLAGLAAALSLALPLAFRVTLLCYAALSLAYSFALKRRPGLDVIVLATLYTTRVIAGGALVSVALSRWFLALSIFLFLSLALVKRVIELQRRPESGRTPGRDYFASDLPVLISAGLGATMASALVYCLYITDGDVLRLYTHPDGLWLVLPLLLYWQLRLWVFALRRQVHDDPVVFALRDRVSRLAVMVFLLIVAAAR